MITNADIELTLICTVRRPQGEGLGVEISSCRSRVFVTLEKLVNARYLLK